MHIDEANINNLVGLWEKYGSQMVERFSCSAIRVNTSWPYRCWFEWSLLLDEAIRENLLQNLPDPTVLPLLPVLSGSVDDALVALFEQQLIENEWICGFDQTAMYRKIHEGDACLPSDREGFHVKPVCTLDDLAQWIAIGSEAFAYSIDCHVIEPLINDKDIQVLLGCENGEAVASALLYKTHDIIGIHQVGVKRAFQGRGIARRFMLNILAACPLWNANYAVLQASIMGQPLYESLGFEAQFPIKNYQRNNS